MHECNNLSDDGISRACDTSSETDNGYYACGVSFKVRHIILRRTQKIERYNLALIVLETAIFLDLVDSNTLMCQFSQFSEFLSLLWRRGDEVDQIILPSSKLGKHYHTRARTIDASSFVK